MPSRADYGAHVPAVTGGGVVATVEEGSPAARAGLVAGDTIVTVDGCALRDVIDWQWLADGDAARLAVRGASGAMWETQVGRSLGEPWGVAFTETVFDGVRTCRNRCAFCFMTQLPPGLRRALYVRDDDYRLSFLQGNFVTLTNLSDADVERIVEQHLSPLYVSLHSTDPGIRRELICAREDRGLERFDELREAGIDLHVQIVLVPGVNDGVHLDESLTWLARRDGVVSVGLVPLGFTAHQRRFATSYDDAGAAAAVVAQIEPWQRAFAERDGVRWVYLADEFYLRAGLPVPHAECYDGFPQYENGIGLVRDWLDDVDASREGLKAAVGALESPVTLVTGELFAPVLARTVQALDAPGALEVRAVRNGYFGGNVTVTGLLTGPDLFEALAGSPRDSIVLVPDIVVNSDGLLLDGTVAAELAERSGRDVRLVSCDAAGLLRGLQEAAAGPHNMKE